MIKEEQLFRNLILKSSKENTGEIIHKYIKKKTNNFRNFVNLNEIFEVIVQESLFVGCREFIRLQDISRYKEIDGYELLSEKLEEIAEQILKPVVQEYLHTSMLKKNNEAILTTYATGEMELCSEYMQNVESASLNILTIQDLFMHDIELSEHVYDIIIFLLNATKRLDDYDSHDCIRALKLNSDMIGCLMKEKRNCIAELAKWYYETDMYGSLSGLMKLFEVTEENDDRYKREVYKFIGIEKDEFLSVSYKKKTAKSLELFWIVKYAEKFPEQNEIEEFLSCNNSQAILCVVLQCLKKIIKEGAINQNVNNILYRIKSDLINEKLKFNVIEEYEDRGMRIGKLDGYVVKGFQVLCKNHQDVKQYISLISYFNVFGNTDLRLDLNMSKYQGVKYSNWEREYEYVCARYLYPKDLLYVVMNSYLKMFVDVFDFIPRCSCYINSYWFTGYITNSGLLRLIQEKNNPKYHREPYCMKRTSFNFDVKDAPEEVQYVRFRITDIDIENRNIFVGKIQTISSQMKIIISNTIYSLLLNNRVLLAYNYLKGFEQTERNLWRQDRFTSVGKFYKEGTDMIESVIYQNKDIHRNELQYIYLNSFLRTVISYHSVAYLFDERCYFLADIYYDDNRKYYCDDVFYIRPNYYSDGPDVLVVDKRIVSPELKSFIYEQLNWFEQERNKQDIMKTIRICFRAKWNERDLKNKDFVTQVYLHCCESQIKDLSSAISVYYTRVQKIFRNGISKNLLIKYMKEYKQHLWNISSTEDKEFAKFLHLYFKYLHQDIAAIIDNPRAISRWVYKDKGYNTINLFVVLDDILFNNKYYKNERFISFVKNNRSFSIIMDDLKSCIVMRKCVYEKTLVKYLYDNFQMFENAIETTVL